MPNVAVFCSFFMSCFPVIIIIIIIIIGVKYLVWCIKLQIYVFIQLSVTHNKLLVNVFLAASFDSNIDPSSGH